MRKIAHVSVALIAVTMLAACGGGGGGGGGGSPSTPPDTVDAEPDVVDPEEEVVVDPDPVVQPPPTIPDNTRDFQRGVSTIAGIDRIPKSSVVRTPAELAEFLVVTEGGFTLGHSDAIRKHLCDAFIEQCQWDDDANVPFTLLDGDNSPTNGAGGERDYFIVELNKLPSTKVVSVSLNPDSSVAPRSSELNTNIVFVLGTGNDSAASYIDGIASYDADHDNGDGTTGRFFNAAGDTVNPDPAFIPRFLQLKELADSDRLLLVGGWERVADSDPYSIATQSNRCGLLSDSCLYAAFRTAARGSGTSFSVQSVAAAFVSVLSVFPDTASTELIKLAKVCAVVEPQLDGIGRADFTCMTVADQQGGWRLLTEGEFSALHSPSPGMMNSLKLPGTTRLSASFGKAGAKGGIKLGTTSFGLFGSSYAYSAGIPSEKVVAQTGLSPILVNLDDGNFSIGGRYSEGNLFFASAYTERSSCFGISEGYDWAESLNAEFGHENFFVRVSKEECGGDLIHLLQGTALGITMQKHFHFEGANLRFSFEGDRFLGGHVETAFGDFNVQESRGWNKRADISVDSRVTKTATFSAGVGVEFLGSGKRLNRLDSGLSVNLKKSVALSLNSSYVSDSNGSNAATAGVRLNIRW